MVNLRALLLASSLVVIQSFACQAQSAAVTREPGATLTWESAIAKRRAELVAQNGAGTNGALAERLLTMRVRDQTARGLMRRAAGEPAGEAKPLLETDRELTTELKQVVAERGWPTVALVGIEASNAAMLVLTHTPDHEWQVSLLPELERLADSGKIDPAPLALVIDKQLVAAGLPQRYGSQFKNVNGHMAMFAVEDPGNLDRLRERAMLPPMAEYKSLLAKMYGLRVTNEIVTATRALQAGSAKQ